MALKSFCREKLILQHDDTWLTQIQVMCWALPSNITHISR